jgi:hypothetical protein
MYNHLHQRHRAPSGRANADVETAGTNSSIDDQFGGPEWKRLEELQLSHLVGRGVDLPWPAKLNQIRFSLYL